MAGSGIWNNCIASTLHTLVAAWILKCIQHAVYNRIFLCCRLISWTLHTNTCVKMSHRAFRNRRSGPLTRSHGRSIYIALIIERMHVFALNNNFNMCVCDAGRANEHSSFACDCSVTLFYNVIFITHLFCSYLHALACLFISNAAIVGVHWRLVLQQRTSDIHMTHLLTYHYLYMQINTVHAETLCRACCIV